MPKVTTQAAFSSPIYRVWHMVTNLSDWRWRDDLSEIESSPDGSSFIEYTNKGFPTLFRITAFATKENTAEACRRMGDFLDSL